LYPKVKKKMLLYELLGDHEKSLPKVLKKYHLLAKLSHEILALLLLLYQMLDEVVVTFKYLI
jgi:hypothetical protein